VTDEERVSVSEDDRRTIARLTTDTLPRLMERLTKSELGELEVRQDGWRIRLRLSNGNGIAAPAVTTSTSRQANVPRAAQTASRAPVQARPEPPRGIVTSPAVGYFISKEGMVVGYKVGRGDPIGFVDMLGVRQEVVAPIDGVVASVDVEPGQAIEYGQPVARIEVEA
jgi:acetyl-CoA carboxylase biotin carboxyl carrier protein